MQRNGRQAPGRITDSTGAVLPGVQVTVVNTQTNFENATEANPDGLPSLHKGTCAADSGVPMRNVTLGLRW